MGKAERRMRRQERWYERQNELALQEQARNADEVFAGMEFGEGDELVSRDEAGPLDQWESGRPEPKAQAKAKSDPWKWARFGTVHDVAALFSVHWKTVELWRRKAKMPFVRIGGVIRYTLSDVLAWASASKEDK